MLARTRHGLGKSLGAKPGQTNGSLQRSEQQATPMESQHYVALFYCVKFCCSRLFAIEFPLLLVRLSSSAPTVPSL